jgi:hypothetical protein
VKSELLHNPFNLLENILFEKGEIVVVVANDKNLFWIAEVTDADDEKIALRYYHYTINRNDEKIYKLHNSTGSCMYILCWHPPIQYSFLTVMRP